VQGRAVVVGESGRDAALREVARRGEDRPLREERDVRLTGGAERCVQPCDAAADDGEVVTAASAFGFLHQSVRI
jgi:hypothetical protein